MVLGHQGGHPSLSNLARFQENKDLAGQGWVQNKKQIGSMPGHMTCPPIRCTRWTSVAILCRPLSSTHPDFPCDTPDKENPAPGGSTNRACQPWPEAWFLSSLQVLVRDGADGAVAGAPKDWPIQWVSSSRRPTSFETTWKIMCFSRFFLHLYHLLLDAAEGRHTLH